jgi:hypothetical protein
MNNNILKFLEITWLVIAVFALAAGVYSLLITGLNDSYILFGISVISLFMFFYRRKLRKAREK